MKIVLISFYLLVELIPLGFGQANPNSSKVFEDYYHRVDVLTMKNDKANLIALIRKSHTSDYFHEGKPDLGGKRVKRTLGETIDSIQKVMQYMASFPASSTNIERVSPSPHKTVVTVTSVLTANTLKSSKGVSQKIVLYSKFIKIESGKWAMTFPVRPINL